jgi:hypothetical protein
MSPSATGILCSGLRLIQGAGCPMRQLDAQNSGCSSNAFRFQILDSRSLQRDLLPYIRRLH